MTTAGSTMRLGHVVESDTTLRLGHVVESPTTLRTDTVRLNSTMTLALASTHRDDSGLRLLADSDDVFGWWHADDLSGSDGSAVASWPVSNGSAAAFTQGTALNRPTLEFDAKNGKKGVRFDGTNDYMLASVTTPNPASLFFAFKSDDPGGRVQYLLDGGPTSATRWALATNTANTWSFASGAGDSLGPQNEDWHIFALTINGASSTIRVDGVERTVTAGFGSVVATQLTLGARVANFTGPFDGLIADLAIFDRVLTPGEVMSIERYFARQYDIPIFANRVYVDTVDGDAANSGLTADRALVSPREALKLVVAAGGTVYVKAPEAAPTRDYVVVSSTENVSLVSTDGDEWFINASVENTDGWVGPGPVWSKDLGAGYPTTLGCVAVTTMTETVDGEDIELLLKYVAGTTPAAGEFGWSGSTCYVRLPGDADPNDHTIETGKNNYGIITAGTGKTTVQKAVAKYATSAGFFVGGLDAGELETVDCRALYNGANGFGTSGVFRRLDAVRCTGWGNGNDGFSVKGDDGVLGVMRAVDCVGAYNTDEGASPHDDTILEVVGGEYHHNREGSGLTAIDNAVMTIDGASIHHNSFDRTVVGEGGVSYSADTTSGSIENCDIADNNGPGIWVRAGAAVTLSGNTSGTANGNALADELAG